MDETFPKLVMDELEIQNRICEIIRKAEKKTCSLADITSKWLRLSKDLMTFPANIRSKISERIKMVLTPLALTAFYLDPRSDKTLLKPFLQCT